MNKDALSDTMTNVIVLLLVVSAAVILLGVLNTTNKCPELDIRLGVEQIEIFDGTPVITYVVKNAPENDKDVEYLSTAVGFDNNFTHIYKDFKNSYLLNNSRFVVNYSNTAIEQNYTIFPDANFFVEFENRNKDTCRKRFYHTILFSKIFNRTEDSVL